MRRMLTMSAPAVLVLTALAAVATAQAAKEPFTAEDMLKVSSISVLDLSDDGRRVAVTARRAYDNPTTDYRRYGDPTYVAPSQEALLVIDTATGTAARPFAGLVNVLRAAWTHDGRRLAILTVDPDAALPATHLYLWNADTSALAEVPRRDDVRVSVNSGLDWTPDDGRLIVTLRTADQDRAAAERFEALTGADVIVHDSADPFLDWDALGRADRERDIAEVDVATGARTAVLPGRKVTSYDVARDGSFLTVMQDVTEKTDYDVIRGTDNDLLYVARGVSRATGAAGSAEPRVIVPAKDLKGLRLRWSDDGRMFAYAKKGEIFVQRVDEDAPRSLTPRPKAEPPPSGEAARADEEDEPEVENFTPGPFSRDGSKLLATSKKGWYVVDVAAATRELVLPLDEDEEQNPRLSAIDWAPDGGAIYVSYSARDRWERGIMKLDLATRAMAPVVRDANMYRGVEMARDGSRFVFTMSDGNGPYELYTADASSGAVKKLTDENAWMAAKALPRSELVKYRDVDGKELYGVLRYPIGYVEGKAYPTVFEIYETFFDNGLNTRAALLTNHGYAVFHPSVNLVVGRPGEAWVKGVTSAANTLIEMGVADPDRLGVHGTSYGGYATVLLITQTDRFKAAINVSGKVDMVSFYTDSPRLGVRNTHAPEKSQDRIGGTLWEYPERYLEHSAVLRADRITTPLLNITGDQDPNVPSSQSREIYYALRRLGKTVEWVRYHNGGHRPPNTIEESIDFENRIVAWYDKYLKKEDGEKTTDGGGF